MGRRRVGRGETRRVEVRLGEDGWASLEEYAEALGVPRGTAAREALVAFLWGADPARRVALREAARAARAARAERDGR